ncbi:MBL fold metallo-hydrolase [Variovorax paradoxus]|uniref:MBL fold metallo-hydrolase n=1 Tax=Variovorax paradoxus TaxID=34073 RepID=A0A5Q0M7F4_VARPD|nr:N-acyl homoserine lactonase family protein [Variovorax paradoxus]QFZ85128.1 MBL fold metallo-hydrolase [Variovorax paradoxus]
MKRSSWSVIGALTVTAFIALGSKTAAGQGLPAAVGSPRVYVLNSAEFVGYPRSFLQFGAQGVGGWTPAAFFLIRHPRGNVLVDTGVSDREIDEPGSVWGAGLRQYFGLKKTPDLSIESQLAKARLKPEDIHYVVLTHLHLDHAGNLSKFPTATFIIQNEELKAAWWPDKGFEGAYLHEDIKDTRKFKILRLEGNLDLFGDRSIEVIRAPGHTPGTQLVVARLPRSGMVVFTGDAVYDRDNLEKNALPTPSGAWQATGMLNTYALVRQWRDSGAQVLFSHDGDDFKTYKQAPAYYD